MTSRALALAAVAALACGVAAATAPRSVAQDPAPPKPPPSQVAVDRALDWLARHQAFDGSWDCDGFESRCGGEKCGGAGAADHDVAVSGLATLCFLGAAPVPNDLAEATTALGLLVRFHARTDVEQVRKDPLIAKGVQVVAKKPPVWDPKAGTIDWYYWMQGAYAMDQAGGDGWKTWNKAMNAAVVDHRRGEAEGDARGSWDPVDPWGRFGGRIYSTAMACLSLEAYYRRGRVLASRDAK